jgi:hypothetical protein
MEEEVKTQVEETEEEVKPVKVKKVITKKIDIVYDPETAINLLLAHLEYTQKYILKISNSLENPEIRIRLREIFSDLYPELSEKIEELRELRKELYAEEL